MHNFPAILDLVLRNYALPPYGYHGVLHWARVFESGRLLAQEVGGDIEVVELFALLHDARRQNENHDPEHGLRGGQLGKSLRGTLILLDAARFEVLFEACRLHTEGLMSSEPTLAACWDADRLDLGRVGIRPHPERLCTDAARKLIDWADERAVSSYAPTSILDAWGLPTPAQLNS